MAIGAKLCWNMHCGMFPRGMPVARLAPPDEKDDGGSASLELRATDFIIRMALLGLFVFWALDLVGPFLPVVIWSVLLAVALYPVYAWLAARLGGWRRLAAAIITLFLLAIVIGPVAVLGTSLAEAVQSLADALGQGTLRVPPPPPSLADLPLIGEKAQAVWSLAATNLEGAVKKFGPSLLPVGTAILGKLAAMGVDVLVLAVSVIIAGFLYVPGPRLAGQRPHLRRADRRAARRGVRGPRRRDDSQRLARSHRGRGDPGSARRHRAVARRHPGRRAARLRDPRPLHRADRAGAGGAAAAHLGLGHDADRIGTGADAGPGANHAVGQRAETDADEPRPETPTLIILIGVIGGTITHGLIGLFLGPVVLAVLYDLVVAWVSLEPERPIDEPL